jgi:TatD DNase family protein
MRAAGVDYPRDAPDCSAQEVVAYLQAHVNEAFAIGEIGLDGYWVPECFWERQEEVFVALCRIAIAADKPIIIHTRKREQRALEILDAIGATRVNWHCFGSRVKLARRIAERGHFLSIPANARRSESFTRMLQTVPREQLLLETDCPYLAPEPGTRNEPASVATTAAYVAELWQLDAAGVEEQLCQNFERLFRCRP